MEIKCSVHTAIAASLICSECGFLCECHVQEEERKPSHKLIKIDKNITDVCLAYQAIEKASEISQAISKIKKEIICFINSEAKLNLQQGSSQHTLLNKSKQGIQDFDPSIIDAHLKKLMANYSAASLQMSYEQSIDKIIEALKKCKRPNSTQSKKVIAFQQHKDIVSIDVNENLSTIIESANSKLNEYYKIYKRDELSNY